MASALKYRLPADREEPMKFTGEPAATSTTSPVREARDISPEVRMTLPPAETLTLPPGRSEKEL